MLTKLSWLVFEIENWLDLFSVCVCFWDPCALKIFVERSFWELKMLFGSLVELHTWLHSFLCFSPLEKLFLKSWLDTSSIAGYLSSFLKLFLIAISTAPRHLVDQSRKFLTSRQLLDTWWIDRASFLLLVFFFLNNFSTLYLSTLLFLDTYSIDGSTPPRHLIYRELLMVFKYTSCNPQLTSVDLSLIFLRLFIS